MHGNEQAAIVEAETYGKVHPGVVMLAAPRGVAAEQYRVLRQRLVPSLAAGIKRIAITSTTAGEGRTTTAVNLALALAAGGRRRVLLLDADVRAAGRSWPLHQVLGLSPQHGLVDVVREEQTLEATLWRFGPEALSVLPAGKTQDPHAIFSSPRLASTIAACADRADVVLLDAPPILPTADALSLLEHVDALLLVVEAGRTPRELIAHALSLLPPVRILGVVLQRAEADLGAQRALHARHDRRARRQLPPVAPVAPASPPPRSAVEKR